MNQQRRSWPAVSTCDHRVAGVRSLQLDRRLPGSRVVAKPSKPAPLAAVPSPAIMPALGRVVGRLTPRQREVLALMATGVSNAAIARQLVISEKAVVQHTSQIYDRLDLFAGDEIHRRVRAVVRYLQPDTAA